MKETGSQRLILLLEICFTAATLLLAALLIFHCARLYLGGAAPENMTATGVRIHDIYSRELVAERLSRISWAFVLWLLLGIASALARAKSAEPPVTAMPLENRYALMCAGTVCTPEMERERRRRRRAAIVCAAVCVLCAVAAGGYAFDLRNFVSRELETVMGALLLHVAPWVAAAFAALLLWAWLREKSLRREIEAAKDAPKRAPTPRQDDSYRWNTVARIALYAAAAVLIAAGAANGGMYDVLVKAVKICTECIGLG